MSESLTVVLPTLNEAANVGPLIAGLRQALAEAAPDFIVVDGLSRDDTAGVAAKAGARVLVDTHGYASSLLAGLHAGATDWVLVLDADGSHTPQDALKLWNARTSHDLVVGSRFAQGGRSLGASWFRRGLSRLLAGLFAWLARLPARDVSSGFRLYRRAFFKDARPQARFFEIQPALLAWAAARQARIVEVGIVYEPRKSGRSKARVLRYGWAFLGMLRRTRREMKGGPT